jgi:hypothetical protein
MKPYNPFIGNEAKTRFGASSRDARPDDGKQLKNKQTYDWFTCTSRILIRAILVLHDLRIRPMQLPYFASNRKTLGEDRNALTGVVA